MEILGTNLQDSEGKLNRIDDIHDYPEDEIINSYNNDSSIQKTQLKLSGNVEFRDVSFGFNPRKEPYFENINFTLEPEKRIAVIGGSGSGKSTIAKLLCGIYQTWTGDILFDNKTRNTKRADGTAIRTMAFSW